MQLVRPVFFAICIILLIAASETASVAEISTSTHYGPASTEGVANVAALVSATASDGAQSTIHSQNHTPQLTVNYSSLNDQHCVNSRTLEHIQCAYAEIVLNPCEIPEPALTRTRLQWRAEAVSEVVVTSVVTKYTTVVSTTGAGLETNNAWTSTIVISGHGSSTNPINPIGHSQIDTATTKRHTSIAMNTVMSHSFSTISTNGQSTATNSPLVPIPTVVNPSKLSSMLSSLLTDTKSTTNTRASTEFGASPKPPQAFTSTLGSTATTVDADATNIFPTFLTALAGCLMLALLL